MSSNLVQSGASGQHRFVSLQMLRAIAAWMVVYHHFMQLYFSFDSNTLLGRFFSDYGAFGVDIFFVLSGFVMYSSVTKVNQTAGQFFADRFFRIAPAYWLYTWITAVCVLWLPQVFNFTSVSWSNLFRSMFFIQRMSAEGVGINPLLTVGWTLNFEMFFYVVLALGLWLSKRWAVQIGALVILILPLVYPARVPFAPIAASPLLHEFLAGLLMAWCLSGPRLAQSRYWQIFGVLVLGLGVAYSTGAVAQAKMLLAALLVFLSVWAEPLVNPRAAIVSLLVWLGDRSYSTYLAHIAVIGVMLHFTGATLGSGALVAVVIAVTAITLLLSALSYRLVENGPFRTIWRKRLGAKDLVVG